MAGVHYNNVLLAVDRQKPTDADYTLFERLDPGPLLGGAVVQRADVAEHSAVLKVRRRVSLKRNIKDRMR